MIDNEATLESTLRDFIFLNDSLIENTPKCIIGSADKEVVDLKISNRSFIRWDKEVEDYYTIYFIDNNVSIQIPSKLLSLFATFGIHYGDKIKRITEKIIEFPNELERSIYDFTNIGSTIMKCYFYDNTDGFVSETELNNLSDSLIELISNKTGLFQLKQMLSDVAEIQTIYIQSSSKTIEI